MGSSQENGAPPSSCLLDSSKRKLSERLQNINMAMAWIKDELVSRHTIVQPRARIRCMLIHEKRNCGCMDEWATAVLR